MFSIQATEGPELLLVGPLTEGWTLERIVLDLQSQFPNIVDGSEVSQLRSFRFLQAIEVTLDPVEGVPHFPAPLSFDTNMVGRDFLHLGSQPIGVAQEFNIAPFLPADNPLHIDVSTRRTPDAGFEHRIWWHWGVFPAFDYAQHRWLGAVSVLLSEEV